MLPAQFRLRWRFDFNGNRPSIYGQWDRDADRESEKACYQNKEGLVRASIEMKDRETLAVSTLAECDGWDFVNFQWLAEFRGNVKTGKGFHRHVGLCLVTRDFWNNVYYAGRIVQEPRTEEDKQYHYATFGR